MIREWILTQRIDQSIYGLKLEEDESDLLRRVKIIAITSTRFVKQPSLSELYASMDIATEVRWDMNSCRPHDTICHTQYLSYYIT
jgi:hypothetical protein